MEDNYKSTLNTLIALVHEYEPLKNDIDTIRESSLLEPKTYLNFFRKGVSCSMWIDIRDTGEQIVEEETGHIWRLCDSKDVWIDFEGCKSYDLVYTNTFITLLSQVHTLATRLRQILRETEVFERVMTKDEKVARDAKLAEERTKAERNKKITDAIGDEISTIRLNRTKILKKVRREDVVVADGTYELWYRGDKYTVVLTCESIVAVRTI